MEFYVVNYGKNQNGGVQGENEWFFFCGAFRANSENRN